MSANESRSVGIIGAGVTGLLTARRLLEAGVPVQVVERRGDVGGLWRPDPVWGGVYPSAHLISSRYRSSLPDFPMPPEFPDYPGQAQVREYLETFAAHHDLRRHITFNRQVQRALPLPQGGWELRLDDGTRREHSALVVASGHHWDPLLPDVPDHGFDGTVIHSAQYRGPELFAGRRVVVVGLGNTAADLAVDAVYAGADVTLSVRGGNHLVPKYLFGAPFDRSGEGGLVARLGRVLPKRWMQGLQTKVIRAVGGAPENFGLPAPTHGLHDRQPLVNSLLPYHLGHGDIRVRPPVTELRAASVVFADGSEEKADVVVWCTGYRVSLPFLDVRADLNGDERGRPRLWLKMFHPRRPDVVAVGLADVYGSFPTMDLQARLAAAHLAEVHRSGRRPAALEPPASFDADGRDDRPDRDWLFVDADYGPLLQKYLRRVAAGS